MQKQATDLVNWYNEQKTMFPWRKDNDPYKIWISEIMLQQTQVNTASQYFINWINTFPNIKAVAQSDIDKILKLWEGLGYYNRAHNIHESSKTLVEKYNCKLPKNYDDLMQLKGIGDYTASAILSIAYKKKYPAIDGNLKRIIARVYAITNSKGIIKKAKSEITQLMERHDPGDINQALMDMGRNICTPRNPKCKSCLFELSCIANQKHKIDKYPAKLHKNHIPQYDVIVGFIKKGNKILISKRKKGVLLGGLWELPGGKKNKNESSIQCLKREIKEELNIKVDIKYKIGTIKHRYSHFKINLIGYYCNYKSGKVKALASEKVKWITQEQINKFAFPKSTLKFFPLVGEKN